MRDQVTDFSPIRVEHDLDVRVVKNALEHARKPVQRLCLVRVGEIPRITVRTGRYPRDHRRIQIRWVESPLLPCVAAKELLVELTAYLAHNHILRRRDTLHRLGA